MVEKKKTNKPILTGKQKKWGDLYVKGGLSGTEISRLAGYKGDDNTLAVIAHGNLRNHKIQAYIKPLLESLTLSEEDVLSRLSEQATANISLFYKVSPQGQLILNKKNLIRYGHLIQSIKETANGIQLTLYNSQTALITLGKKYGSWIDVFKGEIESKEPTTEAVLKALAKAKIKAGEK